MPFKTPIYKPSLSNNELNYVIDCVKSSWISSKGNYINRFEKMVGEYIKAKYCTSTSNGTTALHLALLALGIGENDEVITTNFTYVASTNAILMVKAKPVFCDINLEDLNINTDLIEEKISKKTKAILVTNVYGFLCDFEKIKTISKKYNLFIIEDGAESFGAVYKNRKSGTLGDISTFSFFGNKTITTGEGGMVICKSKKHFELIKKLKNQGNSNIKTYYHDIMGYNYRMTNIQAAIGCAQMEALESILKKKSDIYNYYKDNLEKEIQFLTELNNTIPSYWMTPIVFKSIMIKRRVENALNLNGVETRPFFTPIDLLPFYEEDKIKSAKNIYKRGLLLPSFPDLKKTELEKICEIINNNR